MRESHCSKAFEDDCNRPCTVPALEAKQRSQTQRAESHAAVRPVAAPQKPIPLMGLYLMSAVLSSSRGAVDVIAVYALRHGARAFRGCPDGLYNKVSDAFELARGTGDEEAGRAQPLMCLLYSRSATLSSRQILRHPTSILRQLVTTNHMVAFEFSKQSWIRLDEMRGDRKCAPQEEQIKAVISAVLAVSS
jgi:hypothetical protein